LAEMILLLRVCHAFPLQSPSYNKHIYVNISNKYIRNLTIILRQVI
jgi:hypothetical protein